MKKIFSKFKLTKKKLVITGIIILIAGFFLFKQKGKTEESTSVVARGQVQEELILTGQVKAEKHVMLAFPTGGKLSWVGVVEGQSVKKGQALTSLDKTTLNAAYQQALNNYRKYQASAESTLDSVKDHSGDETFAQKASRTDAEVSRDNAFDAVKAAEYNLKNSTIFAPFAGVVASLPYPVAGLNVSFTDTQVELVDPTSIYFEVDADQSEVTSIKSGQNVTVILDSYQEKEVKGKVSFVAITPKSGEAGTIYKVKVTFDKDFGDFSPKIGMTGDAKLILSEKSDVLYTSPRFVNSDKDGKFVNLGKIDNKVRVQVGIEGENRIEITEGVKEGDTLYD